MPQILVVAWVIGEVDKGDEDLFLGILALSLLELSDQCL